MGINYFAFDQQSAFRMLALLGLRTPVAASHAAQGEPFQRTLSGR